MKKTNKIIAFTLMALVVPTLVFAYNPATLYKGADRVAVRTAEMAQHYFGLGYKLETNKVVEEKVVEVEKKVCDCPVGAVSGPDHYERHFFYNGLVQGGYMATSSTASTFTLTAKELPTDVSVIAWTPNVSTTLSIGATTSFAMVPKIGNVQNVYLRNASSTAGATITLAKVTNSSLDLQMAEATGGDLILNGLDWAKLTFIRTSASEVTLIFDEMTEAD